METRNQATCVAVCLGLAGLGFGALDVRAEQDTSAFSRTTIDLGLVVSDLEASAAFYGDVLGFEELEGFSVPAQICSDAGLTDDLPLTIRVFALGRGETATKLKLMEVAGTEPRRTDNAFIHSQLGFSYLTVYVSDSAAALERCARAGVEPIAKGPVLIGEPPAGPYLSLVRDPDGNLIELIGAKK